MSHERRQLLSERRLIDEGKPLRVVLEEKVERIDHRHIGDEIDFHFEMPGQLRMHKAREVIALRILLPVEEVVGRLNAQRVAEDRGAAMRSGTQADHLGSQGHQTIILVSRFVVEGYPDTHDGDDSTRLSGWRNRKL